MKKISNNEFQEIFLGKKEENKESIKEDEIFTRAMDNVIPLKDNKKFLDIPLKKINLEVISNLDFNDNNTPDNFKIRLLSRKEISHIKKLKKSIESVLDLHGRTVAESEILLSSFVKNSFAKGYILVMVITGKGNNSTEKENGMGVLKSFFLSWLQTEESHKYVISYGEAIQSHGGSGAFYVCLRKNKNL
ncbi:MAG: Smr/MutS family protein [Alphaproteobacteria bacterium]|jgi:DNA-nicking Smr family endonuclease|nr:Smr/MutS family protein [Alphaproteobacteria bacterium]